MHQIRFVYPTNLKIPVLIIILVSIPVPTYYAELDRERASRHLYESVRFQ